MDLSRTVGRATCRSRLGIRIGAVGAMLAAVVLVGPLRQGALAVPHGVALASEGDPPLNQPEQQVGSGNDPGKVHSGEQAPKTALAQVAEPGLGKPAVPKYRVGVVKVSKGDYQEEITVHCTLAARDTATITLDLPLPVVIGDVEVKLGDAVKKGQTLFRYRRRGETQDEIKTSPINGVVTRLTVRPGFEVTGFENQPNAPRLPAAEVIDSSELLVTAGVTEDFAPGVPRGQAASVSVTGSDEEFPAKVTVPALMIDPKTQLGTIQLALPNPDGKLLPGQSGLVRLGGRQYRDVLLVPSLAYRVGATPSPFQEPNRWGFCRVRKAKEGQPVRFELVRVQPKGQSEQVTAVTPGQGLDEGDWLLVWLRVLPTGREVHLLVSENLPRLNEAGPGDVEVHEMSLEESRSLQQERKRSNVGYGMPDFDDPPG